MKEDAGIRFVDTIKERCRLCYTCVRECPAKAIRIASGQAEILVERCVVCGNCVRVCSQKAKTIVGVTQTVTKLLETGAHVCACVAPSFPAAFPNIDYKRVIGMMKQLGFASVHEVAFGADLVSMQYKKLLEERKDARYIATTCPAIVNYVERYFPELVGNLAPIVSPMIAAAAALRRMLGPRISIVFIGPCIAKKGETAGNDAQGFVDAAMTFREFEELCVERGISANTVEPSDFDPPHANLGALFPVSRGMLQTASITEDLVSGDVVAADGRTSFVEAIKEFASGDMSVRLLEVLCCNGCIMGAGIASKAPLFRRRANISQYVQERVRTLDSGTWKSTVASLSDIDLSRTYRPNDRRMTEPSKEEIEAVLRDLGKFKPEDELNCGACGYDTCVEHASAICKGLAEIKMCLPTTIERLNTVIEELKVSNEKLAETQEALLQSEKLASMGQLAAGIAHELNNPLGVVLMYSHLLKEELKQNADVSMIIEQTERCRKIVSGLLHFARQNKVVRVPVDVCDIVHKSLHAVAVPRHIEVITEHQGEDRIAYLDKDQIVQVLTNLISNAVDAMPDGGILTVRSVLDNDTVQFDVADTGIGIPEENLMKIFEPFFTTKNIGKGTGLGLAVSHGIVKMHGGNIKIETNADKQNGPTGTVFSVIIPMKTEER